MSYVTGEKSQTGQDREYTALTVSLGQVHFTALLGHLWRYVYFQCHSKRGHSSTICFRRGKIQRKTKGVFLQGVTFKSRRTTSEVPSVFPFRRECVIPCSYMVTGTENVISWRQLLRWREGWLSIILTICPSSSCPVRQTNSQET